MGFFQLGNLYTPLFLSEKDRHILSQVQKLGALSKTKLPEIMELHTLPHRMSRTWDLKSALQKVYSAKLCQAEFGNMMPDDSILSKLK